MQGKNVSISYARTFSPFRKWRNCGERINLRCLVLFSLVVLPPSKEVRLFSCLLARLSSYGERLKAMNKGWVGMKVSRNFGNGLVVEFSLELERQFESPKELSDITREIEKLLHGQMMRYQTENLGQITTDTRAPQTMPSSTDTQKIPFTGGTLVKEVTGGKEVFKIKVLQWEKFGVAIYPEVAKPSGVFELLKDGYSVQLDDGWHGEILLQAGKAPKVVRLYSDPR